MIEVLERACGMSRNEVRVYLALVKLGSSKAGKISKQAAIDRTSAYNSLKSLMEKGLVSYVTIGKVKWFQAADPRNLKDYVSSKLEELSEVIPALEKDYSATKLQNNVRLYKGERGVKTVLGMIIHGGAENRVFGLENQLDEAMPLYAAKFKALLERKKIPTKNLVRKGRRMRETRLRKVRYAPLETESPAVTNIFGDKIAIIIWSDPPEAILVDNATAAAAYREYFEFMWRNASRS
ncbi:MAG: helix-turn-helix domain-containing protein [Candidatus Micrarchaeia archaeon]